jgi:hypothetical protein
MFYCMLSCSFSFIQKPAATIVLWVVNRVYGDNIDCSLSLITYVT